MDGRPKPFRRQAVNAECLDFDISTHDILGNPLHRVTDYGLYFLAVLLPPVERRAAARESSVRRQVGKALPGAKTPVRITTCWVTRRWSSRAAPTTSSSRRNPDDLHHSIRFPEDRAHLDAEIERDTRQQPKEFALIQSSLGLDIDRIAAAFARVEEAHREELARSAPLPTEA